MKYVAAFTAVFFLSILMVSAMPYATLFGAAPDLVLIFVACWAIVRGQDEAMVVTVLAGFTRDLITSDPVGTSALALAPIVLLATIREMRVVDSQFAVALAVVAVATVSYNLISMGVLDLTGEHVAWITGITRKLAPAVLINVIVTPVLYLPLHWASSDLRSRAPRLGQTLGL